MSQRTKALKKLRELEPEALVREEAELRTAIWKMKVQKGTGQVTDSLRLAGTKRDLARLLTVRREREAAKTAASRA
ncbi:MAG TPA: 50S ribosomal protein L29 [Candidatus Polarisedimenticolaceae bacterium]|nr:50S ribosomal protein L29 [Candidatus Polarisedimenticolaceae bacterium]